jgi:CRP/FNR family cyclic AMP-dependent transcriptional regulator
MMLALRRPCAPHPDFRSEVVVTSENVAALMASPLAAEMTDAEVNALARIVEIRDCKDGEVLVEEGESNSHLYVPITGKISITKRDEHNEWNVLHTLRPGDLAGELSFMDGEPRYASLVASGPTRVLVLDRPRFEALLPTHPVVVYKTMRAIMRVAHKVQRRLNMQMVDMQHYLYRTGGKY